MLTSLRSCTIGLLVLALSVVGAGPTAAGDCNANGVPDSEEISPRFTSHVVHGAVPGATGAHPADLDGDGDIDVAWTSSYDDLVAWSRNTDGAGTFGPPVELTDVETPAYAATAIASADPNGDGRLDVVWTASLYGLTPLNVAWAPNLGDGLFGPVIPVDEQFGARAIAAGDFDGDGDTDIAVCVYFENLLIWYEASAGGVGFGSKHVVSTPGELDGPTSVFTADLNDDDALDLVVASQQSDAVLWYAGDGAGGFTGPESLPVTADGPRSVHAADLDDDGDPDLLVASFHDGRLTWYRNDGSGSFTPGGSIHESPLAAQAVITVDLDLDGDRDVVAAFAAPAAGPGSHSDCCEPGTTGCNDERCEANIAWVDPFCVDVMWDETCAAEAIADPDCSIGCGPASAEILWFENLDGVDTFGPPRTLSLDEAGAWALAAVDVDRDADPDILSAAFVADRVSWHENQMRDCNGNDVPDDCDITGGVATDCDRNGVPDSCDLVAGAASDCNGNQTPDVCDVSGGSSSDCTGNRVPDECEADCDGDGIADSCEIADGATDVNANGVPDSCEPDCNGNGLPDDFDVAQGAPDCDGNLVPDSCQADCDGNGQPDACDTAVRFTSHTVAQGQQSFPYDTTARDVDGDGDLDILSASAQDHLIAWHPNQDGQGTFGPQLSVGTMPTGLPSIDAGDLNGDDHLDVVFAVGTSDHVGWFENIDGQGTFGPLHTISANVDFANGVVAADIDGDDQVDVCSSSAFSDVVFWHRNFDGHGSAWIRFPVASILAPADIQAADLDGDLDLDVAVAGFFRTAWVENLDGAGTFGALQPLGPEVEGGGALHAADVDGDGAIDLVNGSDHGVAWFRNLGGGAFDHELIALTWERVRAVRVADLDGDGDGDVAYASSGEMAWLENLGSGLFGPAQVLFTEPSSFGIGAGDLDGDGDADLLAVRGQANPPSPDLVLWYENESNDCDGSGAPDVCEPDCDDDGLIDTCDPVTPDADDDGVCDVQDCAPASAQSWSPSSPARFLVLGRTGGPVLLAWQAPIDPGGIETRYDVLRAPTPHDFFSGASCVESDEVDLQAEDGDALPPAAAFHYLVRAQSGCPEDPGNLGATSEGTPRSGIACP